MSFDCLECRTMIKYRDLQHQLEQVKNGQLMLDTLDGLRDEIKDEQRKRAEQIRLKEKARDELKAEKQSHKDEIAALKTEIGDLITFAGLLQKTISMYLEANLNLREQLLPALETIKGLNEEIEQANLKVKELEAEKEKLDSELHPDSRTASLPYGKKNADNSSIPTSHNPIGTKTKIPNCRPKTDRKPGGQTGHAGVTSKTPESVDIVINVPTDSKFENNPDRYVLLKDEYQTKYLTDCVLVPVVTELRSQKFKDLETGKTVWTSFPGSMTNSCGYGPNLKSMVVNLRVGGNMAYEKIEEFIDTASNGGIHLAKSSAINIIQQLADSTKEERQEIRDRIIKEAWYVHTDVAYVNVNKDDEYVQVVTCPQGTVYTAGKHKGHFLAQQTILPQCSDKIIISDSEATFDSYGDRNRHAGCNQHEIRYLNGVTDADPKAKWATEIRTVLQTSIHENNEEYRSSGSTLKPDRIAAIHKSYSDCINKGYAYYADMPKEQLADCVNYKVLRRLDKNQDRMLLYLEIPGLPATNNQALYREIFYADKTRNPLCFKRVPLRLSA